MRIAMIGQKGMPAHYGGVERHVHDLSVRLAGEGHDVTTYSRHWYSSMENHYVENVHIFHTPNIHTKHLDAITHTLTSTLHALFQQYDVIHYHGIGPALLSWIPRLFLRNTRIIVTFHSIDRYHQKWNWFARRILRLGEYAACAFAHETITVSHSLQTYCLNEFNKNTTYIPNAVEHITEHISPDELSQFGLEKGNYMVMISRLVPHKGAHILIEAFTRLKHQHPDNPRIQKLKLAIVGGSAYTDSYIADLHRQAGALNDIVFTDFQSGETLWALYKHCYAFVHPSLNEGLPISVIRAMSFGAPTLLSAIPEHLELMSDARFLFRENDVDALVDTMHTFMQLSAEEHASIGAANQQRANTDYSWDIILPQILKVYERNTRKLVPAFLNEARA